MLEVDYRDRNNIQLRNLSVPIIVSPYPADMILGLPYSIHISPKAVMLLRKDLNGASGRYLFGHMSLTSDDDLKLELLETLFQLPDISGSVCASLAAGKIF